MFACAMYPGDEAFLENIKQEAIENVKRLRQHPALHYGAEIMKIVKVGIVGAGKMVKRKRNNKKSGRVLCGVQSYFTPCG